MVRCTIRSRCFSRFFSPFLFFLWFRFFFFLLTSFVIFFYVPILIWFLFFFVCSWLLSSWLTVCLVHWLASVKEGYLHRRIHQGGRILLLLNYHYLKEGKDAVWGESWKRRSTSSSLRSNEGKSSFLLSFLFNCKRQLDPSHVASTLFTCFRQIVIQKKEQTKNKQTKKSDEGDEGNQLWLRFFRIFRKKSVSPLHQPHSFSPFLKQFCSILANFCSLMASKVINRLYGGLFCVRVMRGNQTKRGY